MLFLCQIPIQCDGGDRHGLLVKALVNVTLGFDCSLLVLFIIFLGVDDAIPSNDETKKVDSVLNSITDDVATSLGQSTMLSQGT